MAVVIADLRQHLEGQLTAKKNALTETEDNLRKYVGDRAVEGQGGRPARGRGGAFAAGRGLVRGRSLAERLGNQPDGERGGLGERDGVVDRAAGDMEEVVNKSVMSRVVKDVKSREETLEEQKSDKKVVDRNRRMFGALVGTLQRFNKEEIKKKDVLEKKKVVEKKVEEKTEREKEEIKNRKRELFDEQKKKKKDIQIIQIQMKRVEEYEAWEKSKKSEVNFIRTKSTQPEIYWLPKQHSDKSEALLVESREAVEKEIEERKEKFEAELITIEKKMTADLDRRRSGGRSDGDRLDQSGELDESLEGKVEDEGEEAEEGEEGFMQDRRVVEREVEQDGEQRNGGGDLRMTLKNDLASERIVRRKEDTDEKKEEKEERRVIVKDEKEIEERKVRRDQDRQREEERRIRKEEEKRRDQKRRSDRSEEGRSKGRDRGEERDRSKDNKVEKKVSELPLDKEDGKSKPTESSDPKISAKAPSQGHAAAATEEKDMAKVEPRKEQPDKKVVRGRDSSSDSQDNRKPKRVPARKRQRSGRSIRKDDKSRKRGDSSSSSSEEERRPRKRRPSSSSSSDTEDEKSRKDIKSRKGAKIADKKRSKSSSSDDGRKKVRKGSKPESSSEDSSSDSD